MHTGPQLRFELFNSDQCSDVIAFLPEWRKLVDGHDNHYLQYQSPEWWEHLNATGNGQSVLVLRVMQDSRLVGVVLLQKRNVTLWWTPNKLPFSRFSIPCIEVLGGQPLVSADVDIAARMFESIFAQCTGIQAAYFKSVSQTSEWYDLLTMAANKAHGCFPHISREETFHFLTLPASFEGFLQRFTKKKRYNLKRQLRLMEEAYRGKLRLECITSADRVDAFLEASSTVAAVSWKQSSLTSALARNAANQAVYADLAGRGLFRSYVLYDDERPVAYALGYQYGNIYHYSDIAYAESELHLSPGTVLLLLIVRNLIESTSLRQINFGVSDADYKRQLADQHTRDRSLLVFRSTLRNRLLSVALVANTKAVSLIKSVFRRADARVGADSEAAAQAKQANATDSPALSRPAKGTIGEPE